MKRRTFTVTVDHDDSLFPDEGALRNAIDEALHSRHHWLTERPGIFSATIYEEGTS